MIIIIETIIIMISISSIFYSYLTYLLVTVISIVIIIIIFITIIVFVVVVFREYTEFRCYSYVTKRELSTFKMTFAFVHLVFSQLASFYINRKATMEGIEQNRWGASDTKRQSLLLGSCGQGEEFFLKNKHIKKFFLNVSF